MNNLTDRPVFTRDNRRGEPTGLTIICTCAQPLSVSSRCPHLFHQGCQMAKFDPFLSLDCARVEGVGAQSKERKGSNFAAEQSGAIVQKPEGPNRYDLATMSVLLTSSPLFCLPSLNHQECSELFLSLTEEPHLLTDGLRQLYPRQVNSL